jgi:GNAT superfamily N-acetyltransferase
MLFVVRTAVPSDLEAVQEVFREASLSNSGDRASLLAHPEVLRFAPDPLAEGRSRVAVGPDDSVVGFLTWSGADRTFELEDLFVHPRWMRHGVGRQLIEDLIGVARDRGVQSIEVTANEHAADFYAAMGFESNGTAETRFGAAPRLRLDVGTGQGGTTEVCS